MPSMVLGGLCVAALLLVGCQSRSHPTPLAVEPHSGTRARATSIRVTGTGFSPAILANYDDGESVVSTHFQLRLGDTPLEAVTFVSTTELTAIVPAGLSPSTYALEVEGPSGRKGLLADAFEVLPSHDAGADLLAPDGGDAGADLLQPDLKQPDLKQPDLNQPDLPKPDLPAPCGNKALDTGETCDDGNTGGGDGCSSSCQIEDGYRCPAPGSACVKVQSVAVGGNAVDTLSVGGTGGSPRLRECASDALVVGVSSSSTNHPGWYPESLTELVIHCHRFQLSGTGTLQWQGGADTQLAPLGAPATGDPLTNLPSIRCAKDRFVVAALVHPTSGGTFVQGLTLTCAPLSIKLGVMTAGPTANTAVIGLTSPAAVSRSCAAGQVPIGFSGRSGNVVDALALRCADATLN